VRVAPRELRAVRRDGLLVRFAILGPVAYVELEIPPEGSTGTGLETPTPSEGWGFVLRGSATLHAAIEREFPAGTAFHVPADDGHWFSATGRSVIAGFAPIAPDVDATDAGLRRQGFEVLSGATPPPARPPTVIRADEPSSVFRVPGSIEVETALMGEWVFMRTTYGPMSGFTSGWCDLPHWGLVLTGDCAIQSEGEIELLTAGDVYYCPAGPPGHHFQVPDAATTIDYTPLERFDTGGRIVEWRRTALRRAEASGAIPTDRGARASAGALATPVGHDVDREPGARVARFGGGLVSGRLVPAAASGGAWGGGGRIGNRWVRGTPARNRREPG
jgi:quercetin dioxygenase-like cupin family protein